jgi:leucyl/phenylalanyl-tRNA--protein transferase
MSVFILGEQLIFPDPAYADPDGLLAVGGDLSKERLVSAYAHGIFPWYSSTTPILWWSPDPRPIIEPTRIVVARSLRKLLRKLPFQITLDRAFEEVIAACARTKRPQGEGTWLISEMIEAYMDLHETGLAHSVEAWQDGRLVGGLYGVSLGRAFFGESMFFHVPNASKAAFVTLNRLLAQWEFHFVDCQQATPHMLKFGAQEVSRREFLARLRAAIQHPTRRGLWEMPEGFCESLEW